MCHCVRVVSFRCRLGFWVFGFLGFWVLFFLSFCLSVFLSPAGRELEFCRVLLSFVEFG